MRSSFKNIIAELQNITTTKKPLTLPNCTAHGDKNKHMFRFYVTWLIFNLQKREGI
jgi:hypothetical protein